MKVKHFGFITKLGKNTFQSTSEDCFNIECSKKITNSGQNSYLKNPLYKNIQYIFLLNQIRNKIVSKTQWAITREKMMTRETTNIWLFLPKWQSYKKLNLKKDYNSLEFLRLLCCYKFD